MDVYEAINQRHSVRAYHDRAVEEDKLNRILDAGRVAPSAHNRQEWKFVVVRDVELRGQLASAAEQDWLAGVPVIIAVVGLEPEKTMLCDIPTDPVDCAIAIDHMTLAAVAEGLGTCWIGHFDQDACCTLLDVPPTAKIVEMLTLGYPADKPKAKPRKSLQEIVSYEKFS